MQTRRSLFVGFLCVNGFFLLSQSILLGQAPGDMKGISVHTRYQNKKVYYPETPIIVRVYIKNNSSNDFVLQLADDPILNLRVRVKTLTNISLRPSESYFTKILGSKPFVYRLMSLRPGEEYSFDFDVCQFVHVKEPGVYVVEVDFIPNQLSIEAHFRHKIAPKTKSDPVLSLFPPSENTSWVVDGEQGNSLNVNNNYSKRQSSNNSLETPTMILSANTLGLTIRPSVDTPGLRGSMARDTGEILSRIALAPDEVVRYTLEARQKGLWNKFFLYVNLEGLFLNNDDLSRRYRVADSGTRKHMIENFRSQIMNQELELGISNRPHLFKILSVYYTDTNARVLTRQVYQKPQYQEIKEYTWFLRKETGFWTIYDYEVKSLGTQ